MNSSPKKDIVLSFTAWLFIFLVLKAEILPKIFLFHRKKKDILERLNGGKLSYLGELQ